MKIWQKLLVIAALIGAVVFMVEYKKRQGFSCPAGIYPPPAAPKTEGAAPADAPAQTAEKPLPRLIDLGADHCVPCKMMEPILQELKASHADRFETVFIDVQKNRAAAQPYGVRVIPTQIFLAADGSELFRHEGFFSKEDILAKWQDLGYALAGEPQNNEQGMPNIEGN